MKYIKLFAYSACVLLFTPLLSACPGGGGSGGGGGGNDNPPVDDKADVKVSFYLDYNFVSKKETYSVVTVKNGSLVTEPERPTTPPYEEFPTFLGWSKYQIIEDESGLWNFSKDKILVEDTTNPTFALYGIWVSK